MTKTKQYREVSSSFYPKQQRQQWTGGRKAGWLAECMLLCAQTKGQQKNMLLRKCLNIGKLCMRMFAVFIFPPLSRLKYVTLLGRSNAVVWKWTENKLWSHRVETSQCCWQCALSVDIILCYIANYLLYCNNYRYGDLGDNNINTGWRTKCHTTDCTHNTFLLLKSIWHLVQN